MNRSRFIRALFVPMLILCLLAGCAGAPEETLPPTTLAPTTLPPMTAPTTSPATAPTEPPTEPTVPLSRAEKSITAFSETVDLTLEDYPESLIKLLERNPETLDFVLHYPLEYGTAPEIDMDEYKDQEGVPLFMQWDRRWGYMDYGNDVAGLTACGPVCLSMAAYYFTRDPDMSPDNIIQFAIDYGYCIPGNGTAWALFSEGAWYLGLTSTGAYLSRQSAIDNLEAGNLIVCLMGEGDFTTEGHYILMVGVEDGLIRVNDPNSYANSEKLWDYDAIFDQIITQWVIGY